MPSVERRVVWTRRAGSFTGRDRSISALIRLKTAVFAPMPSARDTTETARKPGLRRRAREAWRKSLAKSSSQRPRMSRHSSLICSTPPNSRRARRRASAGGRPSARKSRQAVRSAKGTDYVRKECSQLIYLFACQIVLCISRRFTREKTSSVCKCEKRCQPFLQDRSFAKFHRVEEVHAFVCQLEKRIDG